jgi:hypothetical protein
MRLDLSDGQAADLDTPENRIADAAIGIDPEDAAQRRFVVHRDAHDILRPDLVSGLG